MTQLFTEDYMVKFLLHNTLGAWWAVLLVSSIGLRQPDLFGFSSMGAGLAAVAAFAVSGAGQVMGYWGRYPTVLLVIALGAALLSAFLKPILRRRPTFAFAKALYLAGAVIAMAALAVEPFDTTPKYLGVDLLLAAAVLALAHAHRAPSWVNYLLAGLITGGVAPLAHLSLTAPAATWHHRFIQVTAGAAVAWLVVALVLREVLRRTASDRAARRHTLPLSFVGMGTTIVLAAYLGVQEVRTYAQFLTTGTSATLDLLGPRGLGRGAAGVPPVDVARPPHGPDVPLLLVGHRGHPLPRPVQPHRRPVPVSPVRDRGLWLGAPSRVPV